MKNVNIIQIVSFALGIAFANSSQAQWAGTSPITTNSNVTIKVNNNDASLNVAGAGDSATALITAPPFYTSGYYGPFRVRQMDFVPIGSPNPQTYSPMFIVSTNGNVGVNTDFPSQRFHVANGNALVSNGDIISQTGAIRTQNSNGITNFRVNSDGLLIARQIDVHLDPIPDYVFHAAYNADSAKLYAETGKYKKMSLQEIDNFVQKNHHLPGIKSAAAYENTGSINLGEMNLKLLEKVEELTLFAIAQQKEIDALKQQRTKANSTAILNSSSSKNGNLLWVALVGLICITFLALGKRRPSFNISKS